MGISKVNFGGDTLIDLTNDSVTADMLAKGATAHDAAGERVIGTFEPALIVTVTKNTDGTFSADKTNQEIYDAFQKGIYIEARRPDLEMVYKLYDVPNAGKASFVSTMMDSASGSAIGYDTIKINSNAVTYQSVNSNVLIGNTDELTPEQVYTAVSSGRPVKIQHTSSSYGAMSFTAFNIAETLAVIASQNIVYYNGEYILAELAGDVQPGKWLFNSAVVVTKVDNALSATSTNPVQNKVITSALEGKAGTAEATESAKGLMSSLDKTKLDSIDYGATKIVVDSKLSSGSKNPVENYIIKAALDNLENSKLSKSGGTLTGNVSGKYFCGTWLQSTEASNLGHAPNRIAVLDDSGWIYYRTVAEILNDIGGASKSYVDSAITQAINSAY